MTGCKGPKGQGQFRRPIVGAFGSLLRLAPQDVGVRGRGHAQDAAHDLLHRGLAHRGVRVQHVRPVGEVLPQLRGIGGPAYARSQAAYVRRLKAPVPGAWRWITEITSAVVTSAGSMPGHLRPVVGGPTMKGTCGTCGVAMLAEKRPQALSAEDCNMVRPTRGIGRCMASALSLERQ